MKSDNRIDVIIGEKDGIRYEIANEEHLLSIACLWKSDFTQREPLILASGRSSVLRSDEERISFIRKILQSNLSLIARDVETNEVVGFRLSDVKRKDEKDEDSTINILTYLKDLKNFDVFEKYGVDEVMEFLILTVKESYTKRGIAKELINRSLELAKLRNFKVVITTPTNIITIHMFEKMGFESLRELSISDYTIDGVKAFPCATPGQFGRLCALRL